MISRIFRECDDTRTSLVLFFSHTFSLFLILTSSHFNGTHCFSQRGLLAIRHKIFQSRTVAWITNRCTFCLNLVSVVLLKLICTGTTIQQERKWKTRERIGKEIILLKVAGWCLRWESNTVIANCNTKTISIENIYTKTLEFCFKFIVITSYIFKLLGHATFSTLFFSWKKEVRLML